MKRFCCLAVLMLLSSSACANESFSFTVGGHRIHIEAPHHCRSASCVSISIPGVYVSRQRGRDDERDDVSGAAQAKPLAAAAAPTLASVPKPASTPAPVSVPAVISRAATSSIQPAAPPPLATPAPPEVIAPVAQPPVAVKPAPEPAKIFKISSDGDEQPAPTPLGDWRTEGKTGVVRIEPCGRALCGRILDASTHAVGEAVLINMKPKAASEWSGNIYSRDSGNIYYATMAMKGANSLRVEACALGRFFCSGNVWSRINQRPDEMVTSTQVASAPRS
jgi:hypothetical protein